jgi:hypothetical protein
MVTSRWMLCVDICAVDLGASQVFERFKRSIVFTFTRSFTLSVVPRDQQAWRQYQATARRGRGSAP